jgi:hypothetical protein
MNLTAIFESWHIGDGNYPPLSRGDLVSLSFEVWAEELKRETAKSRLHFESRPDATCEFSATALKNYREDDDDRIVVLDAGGFRFFINGRFPDIEPGAVMGGGGRLALDHYIWVENLEKYEDRPDLFYKLRVERIRRASIPERFIARQARGKSYPSTIPLAECSPDQVTEIETMRGQRFDEVFYLLDLADEGLSADPIPRSFLG